LLTHKYKNDKLEKTQQLKYYYKKLYGQLFFDEETGELCHPSLQDQAIDFVQTDKKDNE
jgi:hypothetical protein